MPVCQRCGEENPERARFCLACAAPLTAPTVARREERKRVSVLFCDLVGFTSRSERLDVEDVRGLLAPYYQRLRAELERFGGTVEKFIGDAVMALFGAPVAHEDDPERAVRAALAICEAIAEFNQADPSLDLHVRVGVTTGEALVVLDARPVEGEGMASGDVVNTAARLQAAAPVDGVLVDETTFRATSRVIELEPTEPVAAKGKAEPIPVWRALAARASLGVDVAQAPQTALVGRERELGLLGDALARVRSGQSVQLLTLVGVPGMGKSRLVWELLQTVQAEPELVAWRQGRCLPYGEGVALWALGELVKAQAGILESDPADAAAAKLEQAVGALVPDPAEAAWVRGHLRPLVGLGGPDQHTGDRQGEAFAAWRRFLEGLAEQDPTVLVVEDLHWADKLLLDFLDHLVDWATDVPLLVVCTARPELLARRPGWGGGKANSATVSLAPLGNDDTARLVGGLLGQVLLPAEVQAALLARSGGNPLFAEEYVRMLADWGFLRRAGGSWRLERAGELPLPETVQGIIAARLDALGPEEKALVQDAAVLGKVGWLGALAALSGREPSELEGRLHTLERRELLRRERRSAVAGERQYAFRHVLVRDVAYGQLPRAARADKHRRAARWLEELAPDRAEDRAELLAHHWLAAMEYAKAASQDTAELTVRARRALRDAGDHALAVNAFAAAARWYTAALDLWPAADGERPRLLLQLGRARWLGEDAGADVLAEASDALLAAGDREGAAEAEGLLGWLLDFQGQGLLAEEHDRRAVALLEQSGPSAAKAFALTNLTAALMERGATEEALQVGRQALAMAEALQLDEQRSLALTFLGSVRVASGDPSGISEQEQAVAIAEAARSPHSSMVYGNLSSSFSALGDLARAFDLHVKAREAADRFGVAGMVTWMRSERVGFDYFQGRWDDAFQGVEQLIAESEAGSQQGMEPVCRWTRARMRLARGELDGALKDLTVGLELARLSDQPQMTLPLLALHAHALLAAGDPGQAAAQAAQLLVAAADLRVPIMGLDWSGDLAVVLEALGRGPELLELLAGGPAPTRWFQAGAAMAAGRFAEAADRYVEIGSLPDEAFARLGAAERLLAAGARPEGSAQLQRALAFYRQVGAGGYLRRGEALLATPA